MRDGEIGPFTTTRSIELSYSRPTGPEVEVEVEISGILYCDDPEWGIEARDVTGKILARELTDEEVDLLELETTLVEHFCDSTPTHPRAGDFYKAADGLVWKVVDTILTWGETRDRYVLIERQDFMLCLRESKERRRLVPIHEFAFGTDAEGKPLFEWTLNEKPKPDELQVSG
jgi:hypothetical protein